MKFLVLIFSLLGTAALAQQATTDDPALLRDVAQSLQAQRNQALNDAAVLNALLAKANARIKELETAAKGEQK